MKSEIILKEANELKEEMIQIRRTLHQNPEVRFDLKKTLPFVEEQLKAMSYSPQRIGKAGLVATIGKGKPVFLLRADMDALPLLEETDLEFKSSNHHMHACGHDMHTAMLLTAAKIIKKHEHELKGTIKFMFQPAEETFEGSFDMIENGVLENPHVDKAMMMHVMANFPLPEGSVVVSAPGVSAPAADYFEIQVQGVGCHGAMPQMGVDSITIASHIVLALQEINARELALVDDAVLTIGTMHAGHAENAIADQAVLGGTLRTYDEKTREFVKKRMQEISSGIAATYRGEAQVVFKSGCPTLCNDQELSIKATKYAQELLGEQKALSVEQLQKMSGNHQSSKSTGSEDFAYVSQEVPSIMIALASGMPQKGYSYPQHHPKVKFDEDSLVNGAALFAYIAMRYNEEYEE